MYIGATTNNTTCAYKASNHSNLGIMVDSSIVKRHIMDMTVEDAGETGIIGSGRGQAGNGMPVTVEVHGFGKAASRI